MTMLSLIFQRQSMEYNSINTNKMILTFCRRISVPHIFLRILRFIVKKHWPNESSRNLDLIYLTWIGCELRTWREDSVRFSDKERLFFGIHQVPSIGHYIKIGKQEEQDEEAHPFGGSIIARRWAALIARWESDSIFEKNVISYSVQYHWTMRMNFNSKTFEI